MARTITDREINDLITPGDVIDAQDAGIIPDGSYTLRNEEVILQNREIYKWLKSKDDPRFKDTVLEGEKEIVEAEVIYIWKSKVIDETTQLPIEGAKVSDGKGKIATTNESGEFELESSLPPSEIPQLS